jgi:hypothetical protein
MVSRKAKIGAKERKLLQHTPLLALGLDFNENYGAPNGKKKMGLSKERQCLNKRDQR